MKIEEIENFRNRIKSRGYDGPLTTTLDGMRIAQRHYPFKIIREIYGENVIKRFTSIQVIGTPGTGKSTLVTFIAHEIHTIDPSYLVFQFGKKEIINFDAVLDSLPNRNLILIFDDVSLVFKLVKDEEKKARILQALTEARHPKFENSDRRVMILTNVHYENAMEKMWRSQANWKIYTDLNNEELQNLNSKTKGKFKTQMDNFVKIVKKELSNIDEKTNEPSYQVPILGDLKYTYSPFKMRFVMVYDNSTIRFIMVPARQCAICSLDKTKIIKKTQATFDEILELAQKYYDKNGIAGIKLALLVAYSQTAQFPNKLVYSFNLALDMLGMFEFEPEKFAQHLRERAQIKGSRLYTIKRKKKNFLRDLENIRSGNPELIEKNIDLDNDIDESNLDESEN